MEEILHHPGVIWDVYTLQIYLFLLYIPEHMRVYMSTYRYTSEYTDIHTHASYIYIYTYCTLTDKHRYIIYIHKDKHRYIHRYIHTYRHTFIRTDIQTDRRTDIQQRQKRFLTYVYYWYHRKSLEHNRNEYVATRFLIIHCHSNCFYNDCNKPILTGWCKS